MIERDHAPVDARATVLAGPATPPLPVLVEGAEIVDDITGPRYAAGALLGAGGMGEVRAVRDRRIGREVAVKVLHPGADTLGAESRRRFLREARVQGQLEHPSIVPVYDLETDPRGETRLFMKRVRGVTLEEVLRALASGDEEAARRFPRRRLLTAFVSVCRAVDYAHARGVIHRDLKPSNIMLGEFGEVHVLDWGIAKVRSAPEIEPLRAGSPADLALGDTVEAAPRSGDASAPTAQGSLLGTPGFMSPEQARGDNDRVDARTDVFALGAVLFEILALEPLIQGVSALGRIEATLRLGADRSPGARAPSRDVPPELDVACVLATMPAPAERTATAGQLAEAVDRYLDGDRDLGMRRAMAEEQAEHARRALAENPSPAEGHAEAVRLFAKALALDPHHKSAADELGRLLVDAPAELPREAAAEVAGMRQKASRTVALAGLFRAASVVLGSGIALVLGVRRPVLAALLIGGLSSAVALTWLWLRASSERARALLRIGTALCTTIALTSLSFAFGPVILVPAVAMINGLLILGQSDFKLDRMVLGLSLVPVLWSFAGSALGVADVPYQVTMDHIVIPARLVSFPEVPTLVVLAMIGCGQVVFPLAAVARLRGKLRAVEERLFLHSWHLRRLSAPEG
ncbi:MAG: serine/threonine-protein kinase [Byssovorax sp.]